jgi:hypothetical protein
MSELGSGIALDSQFDMVVDDQTGDVAGVAERNEVEKDLAFVLAQGLREYVGEVITDGVEADIKIDTRRLVSNDPRIESIFRVEVEAGGIRDSIDVRVRAQTTTGVDVDRVFTIGE